MILRDASSGPIEIPACFIYNVKMHAADSAKPVLRSGKAWNVKRVGIVFLLVFPLWVMGQYSSPLKTFVSQGRTWELIERTIARGDVQMVLTEAGNEAILSAAMAGENYFLQASASTDDFTLVWLHFHQGESQMAVYKHSEGTARLLGLNGFRSFPQVEIFSGAEGAGSLFFLGERNGTVDLFHYNLGLDALTQLTDSIACEKDFFIATKGSICMIRARTLAGTTVIAFDPRSRQVLSRYDLPKKKTNLRERTDMSAHAAAFYNTYVGFGDSITWGQIAQEQHPVECFLNQIKVTLEPDWGEMLYHNLGKPASTTADGAARIEADLDGIEAQYITLMYGVNDVRQKDTFSLASSRENLAFMIDTAKERGMDVIISTLTPRKDPQFALQDYYWRNLHDLSDAILALAVEKNVASIDTLTSFMSTNPPDGWKDLLETPGQVFVNGEWVEVKGNHPNAQGHRLIADLFVGQFNLIHAPGVTISEAPEEAYSGAVAHFAASATPYEDATILRIEWSFSNESAVEIGDAVDHVMKGEDEAVTVTATAVDSKGRRRAATVQVTVHKWAPPVVKITTAPSEAYAGETVHFAAQATPCNGAAIARIEWTFSGDSATEIGAAVDHKMKGDNQTVTVTATATDSMGVSGSGVIKLKVRALYAPAAVCQKIHVRTLFYDRVIWEVTWTPDPRNAALGFQIVRYWVYRLDAQGRGTKVATVEATAPLRILDIEGSQSLAVTYTVVAVDDAGHSSPLPGSL